jgi:tetratricopeptide (TPR) repeat protein
LYASEVEAYLERGDELYQSHHLAAGRFQEALRWYEQALALRPDDYEILWKLSRRYQIYGQTLSQAERERKLALWEKGLQYGRKAVEVNPEGKEGHFYYMANMGAAAQLKGALTSLWKFRRIKKEMDTTLELDPDYPPILFARAQYLTEMPGIFGGDEQEAMRLYQRVVELDPTYLLAYVCMARIHARHKRFDEATADLNKVLICQNPGNYANWLKIDRYRAEELLEAIQREQAATH